jgi:hypothetical protein
VNTLRIESTNDDGMTLAEFKKALETAERYGVQDDDLIRVDVLLSFSPNGAPVRRVHIPVELT